jgi:hypothetical protein
MTNGSECHKHEPPTLLKEVRKGISNSKKKPLKSMATLEAKDLMGQD